MFFFFIIFAKEMEPLSLGPTPFVHTLHEDNEETASSTSTALRKRQRIIQTSRKDNVSELLQLRAQWRRSKKP